jgi:uncharacterized protein (DUF58 family)
MRAALNGLTTRGRSLVAAGWTAFVLALVLDQTDVMRVGILAGALPLLAVLSVVRTRFRLSCRRTVEPSRVTAGQSATVTLSLENVATLPTGLLLVEDKVPQELGVRPRFVLDRLPPRSERRVDFTVRSDLRGQFMLGPLSVRLTDPFGFCRLDRSFSSQHRLVVTPHVEPLPNITLKADWSGSGDSRSRSIAAAGEDDVAVRDYRHGDELRRVHWRATAKNGSLMVRREEQPWESRCTLLLDTREGAHAGAGLDSSFERSVSAAASAAVHLARRGYAVRLVTPDGPAVVGNTADDTAGTGADNEGLLLEALAVVSAKRRASVEGMTSTIRHASDGLLIAVLGDLTTEEADQLIRARHAMGTTAALICDTSGWSHPKASTSGAKRQSMQDVVALMRSAGWIVAPIRRGVPLAETWSYLAHGVELSVDLPLEQPLNNPPAAAVS